MPEETQTKIDIEPLEMGVPIKLSRKIRGQGTIKEVLGQYIKELLAREEKSDKKLAKKIQQWNRQFRGVKKKKTHPYPGCSNVAVPLTRTFVEAVLYRLMDAIFSQKKVWMVRSLNPQEVTPEEAAQIEDALDWWQKYILKFRKKIFSPLMQNVKIGTGAAHFEYVREQRFITRYAMKDEAKDDNIKKYRSRSNDLVVKVPVTTYEGPRLNPIDRVDLFFSSEATEIENARIVGYKVRMPDFEFKRRVANKMYIVTQEEEETILLGDELDETKEGRIKDANKEYEEAYKDVEVHVCWLKYDVDNDGEVDDIKVSYHARTGIVLNAWYNDSFYGHRPIQTFVFKPIEYSLDGEGLCGILEQLQELMDTMFNQRVDRLNQINAVTYLRKAGCLAKNYEYIRPGTIIDVDETGGENPDLKELAFHDTYPGTERMEASIMQFAQFASGVSQLLMGQNTAERPVARDTLALIQEVYKGIKQGIENTRYDLGETGMRAVEMMAQYSPVYTYKIPVKGQNGQETFATQAVDLSKMGYLRDSISVELMASSEVLNTEIQREIDLTLYQMLSDYYTKVAGMLQALPTANPGLQKLIIDVIQRGGRLMKRVVRDFGNLDAEELVLDEKDIDTKGALQPSPMQIMQMQGGQGGQTPGPSGPPTTA
jgi:hypothetical protein